MRLLITFIPSSKATKKKKAYSLLVLLSRTISMISPEASPIRIVSWDDRSVTSIFFTGFVGGGGESCVRYGSGPILSGVRVFKLLRVLFFGNSFGI